MFLIQLLLPLYDNAGAPFAGAQFRAVRRELTERFGGLTAYTRAPAEGLWKDDDEATIARDDIVIYEVMTDLVDREWWSGYKRTLEQRFRQDALIVRVQEVMLL